MVKDPNSGALSGPDYDIMNEIGKVLNLKVDWAEETGWGVAEQGLTTGRYDVFCAGLWPTPARTKKVFYSRPFMYTPAYVVVSTNKQLPGSDSSWINQPGTTVAVLPNTALDSLAIFKFPQAKKFALSDLSSDGDMMLAIATGKADAGISSYGSIKKYMDGIPGKLQLIDQPIFYASGGLSSPARRLSA